MSKSMQESLKREFLDWMEATLRDQSPYWVAVLIQCQDELFKAFVALHAKESGVERWLVTVQEESGLVTKVVDDHPATLHLKSGATVLFAIKVPESEDQPTLP